MNKNWRDEGGVTYILFKEKTVRGTTHKYKENKVEGMTYLIKEKKIGETAHKYKEKKVRGCGPLILKRREYG